jgi:eukaryotic-like serine/threonine-protein kinase
MDGVHGLYSPQNAALSVGLSVLAAYFVFLVPRLSRRMQRGALTTMLVGALALAWSWPAGSVLAFAFPLALAFGHLGRWTAHRSVAPAQASSAAAPLPEANFAPSSDELPGAGKTLGRYRVERQIGKGAMGAVYLAHDPKIGRAVAIKTLALSRDFEGEELTSARARFFREAELAGRLKHPDIVTIFDADEDQGLAFIAMEFLTGHDLVPYTHARKLLPVPQVLTLVARVAALAHAHSLGVVHRDIKPANVMIDMDTQVVKVTDFGIAQVCDAARTRTGIVMGSPLYMSPEQLSGERLDGRSDLYSLGVMLYQLLTGRLPHESSSMGTLLRQIAQDAAPDVRSIRPELPAALADVVALALQKRATYRYADGLQMATDLQAVLLLLNPPLAPRTRRVVPVEVPVDVAVDLQVSQPSPDLEATVRLH